MKQYKNNPEAGSTLIEAMLITLTLMVMVMGSVDLYRYMALKSSLEKATHDALIAAQRVSNYDKSIVDLPPTYVCMTGDINCEVGSAAEEAMRVGERSLQISYTTVGGGIQFRRYSPASSFNSGAVADELPALSPAGYPVVVLRPGEQAREKTGTGPNVDHPIFPLGTITSSTQFIDAIDNEPLYTYAEADLELLWLGTVTVAAESLGFREKIDRSDVPRGSTSSAAPNPTDRNSDNDCNDDPYDICDGFDDCADADSDGVPDGCDVCPGVANGGADSDGDGVPDACDIDDSCADPTNTDSDGDGALDACDVCPGFNDSSDSDGDGTPDGCDSCASGVDSIDRDRDGTPDACDVCDGFDDSADADGDGIPDSCDSFPSCSDPGDADGDGDGVADACDNCVGFDDFLDSDRDGVPDGCDIFPGCTDPGNVDSDGDGVADACDRCPSFDDSIDTDGDGIPDGCDNCPAFDDAIDSDGDGVPDLCDSFPSCSDPSNSDSDGDGIANACDICPGGDDADDADSDTVPDACDRCAGSSDLADADRDGVPDGCDIFPSCRAPRQVDSDRDGVANACDLCPGFDDSLDSDGDGVPDGCDNLPNIPNSSQRMGGGGGSID